MNQKGFTMLEALVVIGITTLLFTLGMTSFSAFERGLQKDMHEEALGLLSEAARRARSGVQSSDWGVYFDYNDTTKRLNNIILFAGESYATRNAAYDLSVRTSASIHVDQITIANVTPYSGSGYEVVFEELTGDPHQTGNIVLVSGARSTTITIGPSGIPMIEH